MRKILFFSFCNFLVHTIFSQSFTISPGNEIISFAPLNTYITATAKFRNETAADLVFGWQLLEKTTPEGWDYSYCDYNTCYTATDYNGIMAPVIPGDSGFVKVNVLTTHEGWAHFKIRVFNYNEPSDADTVQFWFNGLASVNSNEPGSHMSIYPNPIVEGGKLNLDQLSEQTKITILNSSGQTVFGTVAGKTSISIDMNLVKGIYFLRLDNGEHHENRKIIVY